jgi:hypothetical protein
MVPSPSTGMVLGFCLAGLVSTLVLLVLTLRALVAAVLPAGR